MALSNAEKVRAFRQREKKKKSQDQRAPQAHALPGVFIAPFFEFLERNGNTSDFDQPFDMIGMGAPEFLDDSGPRSTSGSYEAIPELKMSVYPDTARSLDRAELMIGGLLDAATALAGIVNEFKKREIEKRIAEVTSSDLADAAKRPAGIARIVELTKMREQLDKDLRWPVPQWRVEEANVSG